MNYKYLIAILLLIVLSNSLNAQKKIVGFDTGFGSYDMTEIKYILESSMYTNVLEPHCISNFPGYIFFRPYLGIEFKYLSFGIAYSLMSSGSRYSVRDYSGEYKFDAQIVGNTFGAFVEVPVYSIKRFKLLVALESGMIFSKMKLAESLQVSGLYDQKVDYSLASINFYAKPYLKAKYEIWKNLSTNILIGYHKDIVANRMHLEGDHMIVSDFIANWNGIRSSIGVSYSFD